MEKCFLCTLLVISKLTRQQRRWGNITAPEKGSREFKPQEKAWKNWGFEQLLHLSKAEAFGSALGTKSQHLGTPIIGGPAWNQNNSAKLLMQASMSAAGSCCPMLLRLERDFPLKHRGALLNAVPQPWGSLAVAPDHQLCLLTYQRWQRSTSLHNRGQRSSSRGSLIFSFSQPVQFPRQNIILNLSAYPCSFPTFSFH